MAGADWRLCDLCGNKAFRDTRLDYTSLDSSAVEDADGNPVIKEAGGEPLFNLTLDYLGDWAVLCTECSKTHKTAIVPIEIGEE